MQYVGKLVSTVYNTITPNINPATLSGAIDVIVVERTITTTEQMQTDLSGNPLSAFEASLLPPSQLRSKTVPRTTTELASTPFHVRFGKMSVLRPAERKVTLHLNNSEHPLPFAMKVGHSGEAFFVLQIDDDEERRRIPDELVTSPIISAAGSPIVGEQVGEEGFGDEVEPLVLGEAERPDDVPTNIDEDNPEDMDANSRHKLRRDVSVPDDSTKTGSGGAAGSDSLLDKVGGAASKASGVIGAAGRAVIGGSGNPRLDKTAEKAQREDGTEQPTGAPVDQDRQDAHQYEPEEAGPRGKKRQQAAQEDVGKKERGTPPNETQNLEQELRNKAFAVVQGETDAEAQAEGGGGGGGDEGEEAYPAPFGAGSRSLSRSKTQAVDSIRHSEYLAGKRMKPVPIADEGGKTIDPAMTDASTHIYRHNQHKLLRQTNPDDGDDQDTAIDDDDDDDDDPPHRDLHNQVEGDQDVMGAVKVKHGKQDLQYMLDMEGYKMTSDGEVLAYQEGHRFADEMPLGRRHGGKRRHGHSDRLNAPGHQHKVSLPGSSTTAMRRGSASKTHRPSFSVDYRSQRSGGRAQSRERQGGRRESMDDTVAANLVKFNSQHGSPRLGSMQGQGQSGGHQDELELSRDLARLARMNRASGGVGDGTGADLRLRGRRQPKAPQESLRRHTSLNNRKQQQDAGRSGSRQRRNNPHSRHTHEFSLSDTEAEVPRARSNSTENSADDGSYSVSDVVSSLRELRMPSEEVPPAYLGDTSTAHLGLSNNGRWQWADPRASDSTSSTRTGQSSDRRRTRFASTDGYDPLSRPSVSSSNATALEALRRHTAGGQVAGKLTSSDSEPYTFLLQLEDSFHSFKLSLCYSEGFGRDEEADEYVFRENRVSFERFAHDQDVVNDERLVIRYHDRFLTWENASAVLATLSLYRRTLSGRREDGEEEAEEEVNVDGSGSYWSRWWKRSSKSIPDLKAAADSQAETASLNDKPSMANKAVEARLERSSTDSILLDSQMDPNTTSSSSKPLGITTPTATATATASASAAAKRTGKTYAKTLRLTSDQLKSLNLRKGANSITFSVTSSYSGVATCSARIFLWESSHKIVVSDIDGTITKSDALGHVFTMIGRDWTHIGVAKLYTDIARNGYRIMYLTSRAIGQADSTRDYLKGIRQNGYQLPDGPVIMSPDRLIASLHREVILRKPEVFKMACLRDIARLFGADARSALSQPGGDITNKVRREAMEKVEKGAGVQDGPAAGATTASAAGSASEEVLAPLSPSSNLSSPTLASLQVQDARREKKEDHPTPFYAGFGNRITDALSYRSVNIPSSRIFTIDTNGEVKMELLELAGYKSSYIHMTDLVDQMFPPITAKEEKEPRKPEFNDFNYWRPAIDMDIELPPDEELLGTPPVSPALSARSARSLRSVRSLTYDTPAGIGGAETGEEKGGGGGGGRLSRFGLGSLGLSRKGIQSSTTLTSAKTESEEEHCRRLQHATSAEPALETTDTTPTDMPTSTSTSWTAPWRRRAASPPASTTTGDGRATSPLMGPAITAEPESEDEQFYDSEGIDDDDDVSSFGAGVATGVSRSNSFANPDHQFLYRAQANKNSLQQRLSEDESFAEGEDGEEEEEEMEDPLLETGEIRFEWKG